MNKRAALRDLVDRFAVELADILGLPEDDAASARPSSKTVAARRRKGVRPPAVPTRPVSDIDRARGRKLAREMGLDVGEDEPRNGDRTGTT